MVYDPFREDGGVEEEDADLFVVGEEVECLDKILKEVGDECGGVLLLELLVGGDLLFGLLEEEEKLEGEIGSEGEVESENGFYFEEIGHDSHPGVHHDEVVESFDLDQVHI